MIQYPDINPTIVTIGPLQVRWYALMYILSFVISYFLLKKLYKERNLHIDKNHYESLFFYLILGVIVGGRLGYVLFYNIGEVIRNPIEIFAVWHGGMSFHGGMISAIFFGYLFCKKYHYGFYKLADPTVVVAPLGLALGRLGNFINAELYGRPTDLPWGMLFPGETLPRHPSQLYEMFLEGILLFIILFILIKRKNLKKGFVFWTFIFLYGVFRFLVEFVREPDAHLGHLIGFLTMGQILSSLMIIAGIIGYISIFKKKQIKENNEYSEDIEQGDTE
ncbi:MAG TPA: prolipoprotein diacylglyceryl transferase [Candidatus Cloacimonetes bacterium]|nr:prolipoprotein diacylglyceryl transferase [Candidatus Cloacimonadota bacterium]HEX37668.1 prolipoprotein diacylglyceryl transferase [Candidatus Cloacimonadota bacterium]